jgi:hypothetical protein
LRRGIAKPVSVHEEEFMHRTSTTTPLHVMNGRISDLLIPISDEKKDSNHRIQILIEQIKI